MCSSNQTDRKQSKLTQDDTQNDSQDDPKRQEESLWCVSSMWKLKPMTLKCCQTLATLPNTQKCSDIFLFQHHINETILFCEMKLLTFRNIFTWVEEFSLEFGELVLLWTHIYVSILSKSLDSSFKVGRRGCLPNCCKQIFQLLTLAQCPRQHLTCSTITLGTWLDTSYKHKW